MKRLTLSLLIITSFLILNIIGCSKAVLDPTSSTLCGDIVSATILSNRIADPNIPDYIVTCDVNVKAPLTIQQGVIIAVKQNFKIVINASGSIMAIGSSDSMIVIKGETDSKGFWYGMIIESNNPENKLNYVKIQNGGSPTNIETANLSIMAKSKIVITNSTFTKSIKNGIFVAGYDYETIESLTGFSNNYITDNDLYPISITASDVKNMSANSQMTKNGTDRIQVRGGDLEGNVVWNKTAVPLLVSIGVEIGSVANTGNLTINEGMNIEFESSTYLRNYNSTNGAKGFINILGSSASHVVLKAASQIAGGWEGITVLSTNAQNNIEYAEILFGGQYSIVNKTKGNISCGDVSQDGNIKMKNSIISNSSDYGIHIRRGPGFLPDASNTFTGNLAGNYHKD